MKIEVLLFSASIKYLGRKITFDKCHETEIGHRIACAWRRFAGLRDELTNKRYPLSQRLRLFDLTVSSTMLYASATWTLTKSLERQIQSAQRKMLRTMMGTPRRIVEKTAEDVVLEPWVDWIKRATHSVKERLADPRLRDWVEAHWTAKRKWHDKLMQSGGDNWAYWAHIWAPDGRRRRGRPRRRWTDVV